MSPRLESRNDARMGSNHLPFLIRRERPYTCKAKDSVRWIARVCPFQLHADRDNCRVASGLNLLFGWVQFLDLENSESMCRQIVVFANQLPEVIGKHQLLRQQRVQGSYIGIKHGPSEPFFGIRNLSVDRLFHQTSFPLK